MADKIIGFLREADFEFAVKKLSHHGENDIIIPLCQSGEACLERYAPVRISFERAWFLLPRWRGATRSM